MRLPLDGFGLRGRNKAETGFDLILLFGMSKREMEERKKKRRGEGWGWEMMSKKMVEPGWRCSSTRFVSSTE